ncbi:MAG: lysophospholipase, partial [Clostridia bacterium]|nr:lysophospholipase [Clostridia bacterium]
DIYRTLLDKAIEANPDVFIVIIEPFFGKSKDTDYNKYMQVNVCQFAASAKKIAEEYDAVFVPLQDIFDEYGKKTDIFKLLWDGVHPTTGGHQLIARRWKECVEPRLNAR